MRPKHDVKKSLGLGTNLGFRLVLKFLCCFLSVLESYHHDLNEPTVSAFADIEFIGQLIQIDFVVKVRLFQLLYIFIRRQIGGQARQSKAILSCGYTVLLYLNEFIVLLLFLNLPLQFSLQLIRLIYS